MDGNMQSQPKPGKFIVNGWCRVGMAGPHSVTSWVDVTFKG